MFGGVFADVMQLSRTRRHSLTELLGKTLERRLRHAEALEPRERERCAHPGIARRTLRMGGRGDDLAKAAHQRSTRGAVVDPKQNVRGGKRSRTRTQHAALNVAEFEIHRGLLLRCKVLPEARQ